MSAPHQHGDAGLGRAALGQARDWLADADHILVSAGSGLSAAAGYDYDDQARFAELFPGLHRTGFTARYEFISTRIPDEYLWGFWAIHLADVRFSPGPSPVYTALRDLIGDRDHFVMTSNVDQLFARNGFDTAQIYAPQGDYGLYQCFIPCTRQVWDVHPIVEDLLGRVDPETGAVSTRYVPRCPHCGGRTFLNVNIGPNYIIDPHEQALNRLNPWLQSTTSGNLVILEIGAGYNTPGAIRWPDEMLTAQHPDARLIRINPDHPEVPGELADRAASINSSVTEFLSAAAA